LPTHDDNTPAYSTEASHGHAESDGAGQLPITGRKRHQTARVTSEKKTELKFIDWAQILELRKSASPAGRRIYHRIKKAALMREVDDQVWKPGTHHWRERSFVSRLAWFEFEDECPLLAVL
jgi:hypothetical protein